MAKKRPHDETEETSNPQTAAPAQHEVEPEVNAAANGALMDEIQTFMSMRDELAQKLAAEIEATERRLEELRNTAALLFPQSAKGSDDKKAKKAKPKPTKEEKGSAEATSET